jgi:hypothetical protein
VTPAHAKRVQVAFSELEDRATAAAILPQLVKAVERGRNPNNNARDPAALVELASALLIARRFSLQEYIFMLDSAAEGIHSNRITAGAYPELQRLSDEMRAVEAAHGLNSNQYWPESDGPPEYQALNVKWEKAANVRRAEILRELDGSKTGSALFDSDPNEFHRLRERGRRAFFHKNESVAALSDTIVRYEREARAAAATKAYTAAVILLGAAVEGLLLLRCLRSRTKAARVAAELPRNKRPRDATKPSEWKFDTLIQVCLRAGWLPAIDTPSMTVLPDGLAHLIRRMRNFVHPGKVAVERPWIEVDALDFADAEIVYTTLFATMYKGKVAFTLQPEKAT